MTIKKRLWIVLSLPFLLIVALSSLFLYNWNTISKIKEQEAQYAAIMVDFYNLSYLSYDIVIHPNEKRSLRQWHEKFSSINTQLEILTLEPTKQKEIDIIFQQHHELLTIYTKFLTMNINKPTSNVITEDEYRKRMIGQIQFRIHDITANIVRLINQTHLNNLEKQRYRDSILIAIIIVFSFIITGMVTYFILSILNPLQKLQIEVTNISEGKLTSKIDLKSKDELGDFSRALENMTSNFLNAIEQLNDKVSQSKKHEKVLEEMNKQLVDLDRLKTLFIASISHELRTPLNAIIGFSGVLKAEMSGPLNDKQKEYLERIHKAGRNLLAMIVDVIDISKIESKQIPFIIEDFSLKPLLEELMEEIKLKLEKKELRIQFIMNEDIHLSSDRHRLKQSIDNYLTNAVKYSEKGTITITARRIEGWLEVEVSDEGIGINHEDLSKLFQPFERLESRLKVPAGGAGLGLYVTKKIITELMRGEVYVRSHPEEGSTFGLRIPIDHEIMVKRDT